MRKNNSWIEHEGRKGSALADPVREIRGAKWVKEVSSLMSF